MIKPVTQSNLMQAAVIHAESWKTSHQNVCSPKSLALHNSEYQKRYLETEIAKGAQFYMLVDREPVGIVSICDGLIANLYVLPHEQNKGYGTQLLTFAIKKCTKQPTLWILSTNTGARRLYERNGFRATGNIIPHTGGIYELELRLY